MSSSNSSKMDDQIIMVFLGVMDEVMIIVQAVKRLISGCDTITLMTIACNPHHTSAGGTICG
jgi:hypothetical protein